MLGTSLDPRASKASVDIWPPVSLYMLDAATRGWGCGLTAHTSPMQFMEYKRSNFCKVQEKCMMPAIHWATVSYRDVSWVRVGPAPANAPPYRPAAGFYSCCRHLYICFKKAAMCTIMTREHILNCIKAHRDVSRVCGAPGPAVHHQVGLQLGSFLFRR
jgi:hypothetical protein